MSDLVNKSRAARYCRREINNFDMWRRCWERSCLFSRVNSGVIRMQRARNNGKRSLNEVE